MDGVKFEGLLKELNGNCLETLISKNRKYSIENDRLHNFNAGSDISGRTPAQTCWGYLTKHLVALRDMIEKDDFSDREDFLEKCQDSINYLRFIWLLGNDRKEWAPGMVHLYDQDTFTSSCCCFFDTWTARSKDDDRIYVSTNGKDWYEKQIEYVPKQLTFYEGDDVHFFVDAVNKEIEERGYISVKRLHDLYKETMNALSRVVKVNSDDLPDYTGWSSFDYLYVVINLSKNRFELVLPCPESINNEKENKNE